MAFVTGQKDMIRPRNVSGLSAPTDRTKIPDKNTGAQTAQSSDSAQNGGFPCVSGNARPDINTDFDFCPGTPFMSAPLKDRPGHNSPHPIVGGINVRLSGVVRRMGHGA